jgi:transitional endoplasmic reticulum ATPase
MRNSPAMEPSGPANMPGLRWGGNPYDDFISHSSAQRIQTAAIELKAIRAKYPDRALTMASSFNMFAPGCDLLGFAASGNAKTTLSPECSDSWMERIFLAPDRRHDEDGGTFTNDVKFAAYDYEYQGTKFLLYVIQCSQGYMEYKMNFILSPPGSKKAEGVPDEEADALIEAATRWAQESQDEIWVFDRGFWMKDKELYQSIAESSWDDVILDEDKKQGIIDDAEGFFSAEEHYKEFHVPWKV